MSEHPKESAQPSGQQQAWYETGIADLRNNPNPTMTDLLMAILGQTKALNEVAKAQREQIQLTYALLAEVAGEGEQDDDDLPQAMNSPR